MRGEFIGVWPEVWREIWKPLIDEFFLETEEGAPEDLFCELFRELAKALRKPSGQTAIPLLLDDAIALRDVFEGAARRANNDLVLEVVREAFDKANVADANTTEQRRTLMVDALSALLEEPAVTIIDAQILDYAHDDAKMSAVWSRSVESTINDEQASRQSFENVTGEAFIAERAAVRFLESVFNILEGFESNAGDTITNRYFNLLEAFIEKYSLRYDLRRPCTICPTLPGVFASLVRALGNIADRDLNVSRRLRDFKESFQDLRLGLTEARIGNCVSKQVMLLEAIASAGGARGSDLGAICRAVSDWPHPAVREALLRLYGFTSDFPGVRHGTPSEGMARDLDMRDVLAMSILLTGFTPHLTRQLAADAVYDGGSINASLTQTSADLRGSGLGNSSTAL